MGAYLVALSVGPVQGFIAAARRTRDLFFGSTLLSEISKAVAKSVEGQGGQLIVPSPKLDLRPNSEVNVANVVLAELADGNPREVARKAKDAARERWRQFADKVFNDLKAAIRQDVWADQVEDVIEFYAAWAPFDGKDYAAAYDYVSRLLAARKSCRDFLPAKGRQGVPKSSLDGLRESVLTEDRQNWPFEVRRLLRVRPGEQLDVAGVVKRAAMTVSYPSVSRIAADPWIRGLQDASLEPLKNACGALSREVLPRIDTERYSQYARFPYEGTVVFRSRHHEFEEELGINKEEDRKALDSLGQVLSKLYKDYGEPDPYLAILVADGDRMGAAIRTLRTPEENRALSKELSCFAEKVKEIVKKCQGVCVYSGGDDILAFVPVDWCLFCARELYEAFSGLHWPQGIQQKPTLSVGVAIAHFLEPLEDILNGGRDAEHHAKNPRRGDGSQTSRNGLAVHLHKRSGGPIALRSNWSDGLDKRLTTMADHLCDGSIPARLAEDLYRLARVYEGWDDGSTRKEAVGKDALRVLDQKECKEEGRQFLRGLVEKKAVDADSLRRLADELLVARQIASAIGQANRSRREAYS